MWFFFTFQELTKFTLCLCTLRILTQDNHRHISQFISWKAGFCIIFHIALFFLIMCHVKWVFILHYVTSFTICFGILLSFGHKRLYQTTNSKRKQWLTPSLYPFPHCFKIFFYSSEHFVAIHAEIPIAVNDRLLSSFSAAMFQLQRLSLEFQWLVILHRIYRFVVVGSTNVLNHKCNSRLFCYDDDDDDVRSRFILTAKYNRTLTANSDIYLHYTIQHYHFLYRIVDRVIWCVIVCTHCASACIGMSSNTICVCSSSACTLFNHFIQFSYETVRVDDRERERDAHARNM